MLCTLGKLFMVSSLSFGFSVVGFHSPPLRLFTFFSCILWCRCAELVFWSFGLFYSEFCGSSLAWTSCMCLFSLWGASYLLAGGCDSGAWGMCLLGSWWLWSPDDYSFSDLFGFFGFFGLVLDHAPLISEECFVLYFTPSFQNRWCFRKVMLFQNRRCFDILY